MAAHIPSLEGATPATRCDFVIDPRQAVVALAVRPDFYTRGKTRRHSSERVDESGPDDNMLGSHDVDGVRVAIRLRD